MQQKRVKLRLYIEGIRIPVVSANVSGGTNMPATAAIQVLPDPSVMDFPPRTLVHLFFYDYGNPDETAYVDLDIDDENEAYRLLFWGDVVMVQHNQTAKNHSMVIQCAGVSSYWDQAKQYFKDSGQLSSSTAKRMAFLGTDVIQYDGESRSPASSVVRLLTTKPVSNPDLQGLLGGCVHLLEGIGGIYKGPKRFKGLNDFFAAAELRLKLSQNIWASPKDDTSTKMFRANDFKKWIAQAIRSKGGMISFGEILQIVLAAIHHESHSMLAPRFKRAKTKSIVAVEEKVERKPRRADSKYFPRLSIGPEYDVLNSGQTRQLIIKVVKQRIETLEKYIEAINPTRIVHLFGDATSGYYAWENSEKLAVQGALDMANQVEAGIKRYETETGKVSDKHWGPGADLLTYAFEADQVGMTNSGRGLRELQDIKVVIPDLDTTIEQPQITRISAFLTPAGERLMEALDKYKKLIKYTGGGGKGTSLNYDALDRLIYQLITPQLYFVAPPSCNVIFPEQRTSMSYTRDFMAEITRLQIAMHDKANTAYSYDPFGANKHVYYAPDVQDTLSKRMLSDTKKGTRVLMPHEKHSGIIPDLQQLAGVNVFATNADSSSGYLQRVANFTFFKSRFASRTMNVMSGFNPYIATGFPALIIDKALPLSREEFVSLSSPDGLEKLRGQRLEKIHKSIAAGEWDLDIIDSIRMPVHYFGQVRAVRHSLTSAGGHTQVSLAFCRTHDEKMEFLGADDEIHKKVIASGSEVLGNASVRIDDYEFEEYDVDPTQYDTSYLDEDTITAGALRKARFGKSSGDPLANINDGTYTEPPTDPPDGVQAGTGKWVRDEGVSGEGQLFVAQRSDSDTPVGTLRPATPAEYKAFVDKHGYDALTPWRYEKKWAKYESYKVKIPPEQALMPTWFSDIYENENIGPDFYRECLGIGSIVDAYEISFAPGAPVKLDFGGVRSTIEQAISDPGNSLPLNRDLTADPREAVVEVNDIEHAVNVITMLYSAAKEDGADVDRFITEFTYRPVANMIEIFGSEGIGKVEPGVDGYSGVAGDVRDAAGRYVSPGSPAFDPNGERGFHENAFSAIGDMSGLVPADPTSVISGNSLSPDLEIDRRVDPRPERHRAVMRYFQRLLLHKAIEQ